MTAPRSFDHIRQSQEYRLHRRDLVRRFFGVKPTVVERNAIDTCALLQVRAQWSAVDPAVSADELSKVVAAARRALTIVQSLSEVRRSRAHPALSVDRLIERSRTNDGAHAA